MCEWSDGVHSLEIEHIDTEKGSMSGVLFKGLEKKEVNGEVVYTGTVEPDITDLPDFYLGYTKLMANVEAKIDESGDLSATIVFTRTSLRSSSQHGSTIRSRSFRLIRSL